MKSKLIIVFFFVSNVIIAQDNYDYRVVDTIFFKEIKAHNISFEKCPGILSGIPCTRYLNFLDEKKPNKWNIESNRRNLFYKFLDDEILILNVKDLNSNVFKELITDKNDVSTFKIRTLNKKGKFYTNEIVFINLKAYKISIKRDLINQLLRNNIMIKTSKVYIDIYLIYN
jgi:hypothetical protein